MKEHPLIFQPCSMEALLSNRKTQSRRLPGRNSVLIGGKRPSAALWAQLRFDCAYRTAEGTLLVPRVGDLGTQCVDVVPAYAVGDLIWSREAWWHYGVWLERGDPSEPSGTYRWHGYTPPGGKPPAELGRYAGFADPGPQDSSGWYWRKRSPIHQPRWASRFEATLTTVRWERLGDLTEEDARAEGVTLPGCDYVGRCNSTRCRLHGGDAYRRAYEALWRARHGTWEPARWVLVLEWEAR